MNVNRKNILSHIKKCDISTHSISDRDMGVIYELMYMESRVKNKFLSYFYKHFELTDLQKYLYHHNIYFITDSCNGFYFLSDIFIYDNMCGYIPRNTYLSKRFYHILKGHEIIKEAIFYDLVVI